MQAGKYAKEILSKLWVSLLSAPIIWAVTLYYSRSISGMFSEFEPDWYKHYWFLVLIAVALGVLQLFILWTGSATRRNVIISLLLLIGLIGVYAYKSMYGTEFPFDWSLKVFFFLYNAILAMLISICIFGIIKITMNILDAAG